MVGARNWLLRKQSLLRDADPFLATGLPANLQHELRGSLSHLFFVCRPILSCKPENAYKQKKGFSCSLKPRNSMLPFAEREGFEPPEQLPVHRISSAARSTTPASLQLRVQI